MDIPIRGQQIVSMSFSATLVLQTYDYAITIGSVATLQSPGGATYTYDPAFAAAAPERSSRCMPQK